MKLKAMAVNTAITAGWRLVGHGKADRYEEKTEGDAKGREGLEGRQHREFDDCRGNDADGGAERERDSAAVGQIAPRREQQEHDRDEHHRFEAPFGQAVTTQKSSTAPIVTNARAALTRAGSQSGTLSRKPRWPAGGSPGASTSSASPSSTCTMPASTLAVSSASSRSDGVPAGRASSVAHRLLASAAQGHGISHPACRRTRLRRRSQLGRNAAQDGFRPLPIPRRPASGSDVSQLPRQPSSALNRPWTAVCNVDEW